MLSAGRFNLPEIQGSVIPKIQGGLKSEEVKFQEGGGVKLPVSEVQNPESRIPSSKSGVTPLINKGLTDL